MRDALLIVNPTAGRGRGPRLAPKVTERLAALGYRAAPVLTTGPGDATRLAREAAGSGAEAVFALGGDGTLRETAAGLLGTDVPLGPLPGGTTNVLTLALGLPRGPLAAAEAVARAAPRWLDVGLCGTTPFLMMVSAGVDSAAVAALHPLGARWFGRVGVAVRGLGIWWSYGYPPIEVTT
ncbi:MAG: diacylglycerol kinase family protein, partial [Acidobacteriota bacterium]